MPPGRPRIPAEKRLNYLVGCRVTAEEADRLFTVARARGTTATNLLRRFILQITKRPGAIGDATPTSE